MIGKLIMQRLRYEAAIATGLGITDGVMAALAALQSGEQNPDKLAELIRKIIEERIIAVETPRPTFEVALVTTPAPPMAARSLPQADGDPDVRRSPGRPRKNPLDQSNTGEQQP